LQNRCNLEDQAAWKRDSGCAGERGGARAGKPRCVRILTNQMINQKAAKTLGITIPPSVMVHADRVVE
jgi:hypothetical protein